MTELRVVEETRDAGLVQNQHELELRAQSQAHRMAWFSEFKGVMAVALVVGLYLSGHGPMAERLLALIGLVLLGMAAARRKDKDD